MSLMPIGSDFRVMSEKEKSDFISKPSKQLNRCKDCEYIMYDEREIKPCMCLLAISAGADNEDCYVDEKDKACDRFKSQE